MNHLLRRWSLNSGRRFLNFTKIKFDLFENSRGLCDVVEDLSWKSMEGVVRCSANYSPLSPISFLERAGKVYRDRTSVVYGSVKMSWAQTLERCVKMASALVQLGIGRGDVVATLAPNIPAMQELHFAVPMAGAILCTMNIRHDSTLISVLLQHSEAKIIFVDHQLLHIARGAFDLLTRNRLKPPILVLIPECNDPSPSDSNRDFYEYETLLASGDSEFVARRPKTEWDPISINYTSGTTSRPKGVVYNHRGAYLNALATSSIHGMGLMPVYLWTVPMFHCNAWCLVWGLAALGGTNICLRHVSPKTIFELISLHRVTHMSGAPTVLNMLVNSSDKKKLPHLVDIMTGGAPPPPSILSKIEELGFRVSHSVSECILYRHPGILEAAVVARPDDHWGQTPCAFVKLKEGVEVSGEEIIKFCRDHLPHYMAPRTVVFEDIPKTSTGKIQKFILREKAKALGSLS